MLYHYPTKDHLFVAVMAKFDARQLAASPPWSGDLEAGLALATDDAVAHPYARRLFMRVLADAADPDHPAHDFVVTHHTAVRQLFRDALLERQRAGLAHPGIDAARFAVQMVAIWDGLQAQWLIDPGLDLTGEVLEAFRRLSGHDAMGAKRAMEQLAAEL